VSKVQPLRDIRLTYSTRKPVVAYPQPFQQITLTSSGIVHTVRSAETPSAWGYAMCEKPFSTETVVDPYQLHAVPVDPATTTLTTCLGCLCAR
jgi:hypothetical protein